MEASEKGLGRLKYHDESQRCEENWISVVEAKEGRRSRDPDFGISEAQRKVRASDRNSQEDDFDPSLEYGFDGKIGMWPFTVERVANWSSPSPPLPIKNLAWTSGGLVGAPLVRRRSSRVTRANRGPLKKTVVSYSQV